MYDTLQAILKAQLAEIRDSGLYKSERIITSPQQAEITVKPDRQVINFCANNYLGLANDPELVDAAKRTLDEFGFGLSSVRFICGTQSIHKRLEQAISDYLGTEDTILYASCFDANAGLFEALLTPEDAIISDQLNHASIIDGIRLCKAQRHRFPHADMAGLEEILQQTQDARVRMIATDGVFSMDGDVARLGAICDLAEKYDAVVMIDDCHATGFFGPTGRGTPEHCGVQGRIDVINSTLGKALGGASGGFTSGRKEIVEILRQRSRPYLFSNSVPPAVVGTALAVMKRLSETIELRQRLADNTAYFREQMTARGFDIKAGEHPIVPIMLGDARLAKEMADQLLEEGIYVIGFSYPVVPRGEARIRVQVSAAHTREQLDLAVDAFSRVYQRLRG